jgi:2-polyprenyl-6-methoxyphenol hydroxylase-like FAD-dependent oxidoreductase
VGNDSLCTAAEVGHYSDYRLDRSGRMSSALGVARCVGGGTSTGEIMARIVVLGAGVCGLSAATMLAKDGHDVMVVERDDDRVPNSPTEAWDNWERRGIAQFRQPNWIQPAGARVLDTQLREVSEALLAAGGLRYPLIELMPPTITDRTSRPDDGRFTTLTARRPVVEYAVASVARQAVRIRWGVTVAGLVTSEQTALPGIPHIAGVVTTSGERIDADLVVDASGRRSVLPRWLADQGARPVNEESSESGFYYYTRYFSGTQPLPRGPLLCALGSISLLTLPADNGTWSVTVVISAGDSALRTVRETEVWTRVVQACPLQAHWLEGTPLTEVLAMGGALGRLRGFRVDEVPVATGVVAVGDALACTNPSLGRGISLGLMHACELRSVVRAHADAPSELSRAWQEVTETRLAPWYWASVRTDNDRYAQIAAVIAGHPVPDAATPAAAAVRALVVAAAFDADLFRGFLEIQAALARPEEVLERPGLVDRLRQVTQGCGPRQPPPCPDRQALLELVGA